MKLKTIILISIFFISSVYASNITMLHVSYDTTRKLFKEINALFAASYKLKTGNDVKIEMSHGGSGKQARSVIEGLEADVVSLALAYDIDIIAEKTKSLPENWQGRLPDNSSPFYSTIVFLVRKGNPKKIYDWGDLVKPGVSVITANPKTSGGARWNYLAAWGYIIRDRKGTEAQAKDFVARLYRNVGVLDAGSRGSTTTFVQRGIGDVLITWENEALLAANELGKEKFEIIVPHTSILAEPPVAVVDKYAKENENLSVAGEYLGFLYTEQIQEVLGKHYFRPRSKPAAAKFKAQFPDINLYTVNEVFGNWLQIQKIHFSQDGIFDQIYGSK